MTAQKNISASRIFTQNHKVTTFYLSTILKDTLKTTHLEHTFKSILYFCLREMEAS